MATAKQRQIWFWQKENGDFEGAKQAKRQYIEARKTLEELEGE